MNQKGMEIVKLDAQLPAVSEDGNLSALIRTIRGVQVMLDRDLSKLYGVETGALNRQVKRNEERFPEDFMFRLSADEWTDLKCQNGISSWGGDRQLPYAFTENGIAMLSSVLRSDIAISVNIRIMRAFSAMRRFLLANAQVFQRIEMVEKRQIATETKVDAILERLDASETPVRGVFYDGQLWDARALVLKLIHSAKRSLILIDNWATAATLDLFTKKRKGVKVTIFTSEHYDKKHVSNHKISDADIATFNAQYQRLAVRFTENFHDRFLIVDDKELYLIGASLKDLGKKCFALAKLDPSEIKRIKKEAFGADKRRRTGHDRNPASDTSQLRSLQILDDCQRTLDLMECLPDGDNQSLRSHWMICIDQLRRVSKVIEKYDLDAFPEMRKPYEERKKTLSALVKKYNPETPFSECPRDYLIYHRLINGEIDVGVDEGEQSFPSSCTFHMMDGSVDIGNIYLPMEDVDLWGDWDCRDWLKEGIDWWRQEIAALIAKSTKSGSDK